MPHEPQTNPPRDERRDLLARVRRADWRFLVPDEPVRRVALAGSTSASLRGGLEAAGVTLDDSAAAADTVVVEGGLGELSAAAALVPPGARLYAEIRPRRFRSPARALGLLRAAGFDAVEAHWHHPDFERCEEIVPLVDEAIVRHALSRRGSRVRAAVGRLLLRAGLLERAVPCVSILARRGDREPGERRSGLPAALAGAGAVVPLGSRMLLLTPRFAASRHVIVLFFAPDEEDPSLVAKIPRLATDVEGIRREARALRALAGLDTSLGAPRLVAYEEGPAGGLLVESALRGVPMAPARVRHAQEDCVRAVGTLLAEIGVATAGRLADDPSWFGRLLETPVRKLAGSLGRHDEGVNLAERTLELLAPLRYADVPRVLEHGDVAHPNLVVLPSGRAGLVDWELSEPQGLPGHDLFFFLAYVAAAAGTARTTEQRREVFAAVFFGPSAPYEHALREYLRRLRVPVELAPHLFLACWARYAAALAERVADGGGGADATARVRNHRYWASWRMAVECFDRLRLTTGAPGRLYHRSAEGK